MVLLFGDYSILSISRYIVLNRNCSANELEGSSRSFNPLAIFNDMKSVITNRPLADLTWSGSVDCNQTLRILRLTSEYALT